MIRHFSYLLALCFILVSCEGAGIADVTNGKEYDLYDYYVDENGEEGIVVLGSSKNKYILVMSLDESECIWSKTGVSVANGDTLIRYYDERALLLNQRATHLGLEKFPALKWCIDKNHGKNYPDINSWILPSLYHRSKRITSRIQYNYELINQHIESYRGIPLSQEAYYWLADEPSMIYTSSPVSDTEHSLAFTMSGDYIVSKERTCKVRAFKYILF